MVPTGGRWRRAAVIAVLAVAVAAGRIWGLQQAAAVGAVSEEVRQQVFDAVYRWLQQAHVARRNLPERIIDLEEIGPDRYRVHMQMVEGEGYFEVWKEDGTWQVRGLQPPPQAGPE